MDSAPCSACQHAARSTPAAASLHHLLHHVAPQVHELPNLALPLKLAVIGAPFSGKSAVAVHLADKYGLKYITPEVLVLEAVQAAESYVPPAPEPPAEEGGEPVVAPVPAKVTLGAAARASLAKGDTVADEVLVQLVAIAINEAHDYIPASKEPPPPPPPPAGKAAPAKGKAAAPPPPVELPKPQARGPAAPALPAATPHLDCRRSIAICTEQSSLA